MTAENVSTAVQEVQQLGDIVLESLSKVAPGVAVPAAAAEAALNLVAKMVTVLLAAYSEASATPITVESLQALLPNPIPLTAPDPA